jgi:tRNA dimethylallyltransferase
MRIPTSGVRVSASVSDSIGMRELLEHLRGEITAEEARSRVNTRTRQLARRQIRWFDKLARALGDRVPTTVIARPQDLNTMHDTIWV